MSSDELVQLVDADNQLAGAAPRWRVRTEGLYHRATYLFVFNTAGELFLQRRAETKDLYPGFYDACAGGVVVAGETYEQNAIREADEELGLEITNPFGVRDFLFEHETNRVWGRIFRVIAGGPFAFADREVVWGQFVSPQSVLGRQWLPITPDSLFALQLLLQAKEA
ncbi:MAG: NUDIX domain-containing protein [Pseudomonadota bacterium]